MSLFSTPCYTGLALNYCIRLFFFGVFYSDILLNNMSNVMVHGISFHYMQNVLNPYK